MKKYISLPLILLLALITSSTFAFFNHDNNYDNWFITPKIGVAPSIFAHRAHQLVVVPRSGVTIDGATTTLDLSQVLQETPRIPKFSDLFTNGVVHVGVEIGRTMCERGECFLEFTYNYARGNCSTYCSPFITQKAAVGCSPTCGSDCSSSCSSRCDDDNDCCFGSSIASLSDIQGLNDAYSNYQTYGAFLGGRHLTKKFWCQNFAFWYGYKVGFLHRNRIDACTTISLDTSGVVACTDLNSSTVSTIFRRSIFCQSNSVSGGLQGGFDYNWNDCLSFQLGFEVVASAGLKGNRNAYFDITQFSCGIVNLATEIDAPTNFVVGSTGTLLNFPVWLALTWTFGGHENCCD